jgi:hypothetical protein
VKSSSRKKGKTTPTHETIYRHKQMGKRMGTLGSVQAGDLVTFCTASGFHTRTVARVNTGSKFLVTEPMVYQDLTIHKAQEVSFKDLREVLRSKNRERKAAGR